MNENKTSITNENEISPAKVWAQIRSLQEQLSSLPETTDRIFAVSDTDEFDGEEPVSTVNTEVATAKIEAIKAAFTEREKTLQLLLDFYITVYRSAAKY